MICKEMYGLVLPPCFIPSVLFFSFLLFISFLHEGREKPLTKISDEKEVGGIQDFQKSKMPAMIRY